MGRAFAAGVEPGEEMDVGGEGGLLGHVRVQGVGGEGGMQQTPGGSAELGSMLY